MPSSDRPEVMNFRRNAAMDSQGRKMDPFLVRPDGVFSECCLAIWMIGWRTTS